MTPARSSSAPHYCPLRQLAQRSTQQAQAPFILTAQKTLSYQQFDAQVTHLQQTTTLTQLTASPAHTYIVVQFATSSLLYLKTIIALYRQNQPTLHLSPRTPRTRLTKLMGKLTPSQAFIPATSPPAKLPLKQKTQHLQKKGVKNVSLAEATVLRLVQSTPPTVKKPLAPSPINIEMPMEIIFTSGTTGQPKGVVCTLKSLFETAHRSNKTLGVSAKSCWYLSLPLYHISGLSILFRALMAGARLYVDEAQKFSAQHMLDAIAKHNITHISLVPAQLKKILALPQASVILKRCKVILLGGSPLSRWLWERCNGLPLYVSYGMSETLAHIALHFPGMPYGAYRLLPQKNVRIAKPKQEIEVHRDNLALGYLKKNNNIAFPLTQDNYFATGDYGLMTQEGILYLAPRRLTQKITSGGETFSTLAIEKYVTTCLQESLLRSPFLSFSAKSFRLSKVYIIGRADIDWGERPVAVLLWQHTGNAAWKENKITALRTWLTQEQQKLNKRLLLGLEKYKCPVAYYLHPFHTTNSRHASRKFYQRRTLAKFLTTKTLYKLS